MSTRLVLAPAFALLAACGAQKSDTRMDDALQNDLSLASQAQAYRQQQYVSPQELGMQPYGPPGAYPTGYVPQQVPAGYANGPYYAPAPVAAAPRPVERTRVVYRDRPSSGTRSSGGSGAGTVATAPRTTVKKNTKRDAAIGAAAGAAIGVATSARKDRLKGGLLGAVAGGVLGAVVGNNVDKQTVRY